MKGVYCVYTGLCKPTIPLGELERRSMQARDEGWGLHLLESASQKTKKINLYYTFTYMQTYHSIDLNSSILFVLCFTLQQGWYWWLFHWRLTNQVKYYMQYVQLFRQVVYCSHSLFLSWRKYFDSAGLYVLWDISNMAILSFVGYFIDRNCFKRNLDFYLCCRSMFADVQN